MKLPRLLLFSLATCAHVVSYTSSYASEPNNSLAPAMLPSNPPQQKIFIQKDSRSRGFAFDLGFTKKIYDNNAIIQEIEIVQGFRPNLYIWGEIRSRGNKKTKIEDEKALSDLFTQFENEFTSSPIDISYNVTRDEWGDEIFFSSQVKQIVHKPMAVKPVNKSLPQKKLRPSQLQLKNEKLNK